jgi:hypothetical protein
MPAKKYIICLSPEEREELEQVSRSHRRSGREKMRARILLLCDTNLGREEGASRIDEEIAIQLGCGMPTVFKVPKRAVERGVVASLIRQEQHNRKARALDGVGEAHLVALTCSTPPEGEARWSLRLLRERLIEMEVVEHVGLETVRRTLKKTPSSRG